MDVLTAFTQMVVILLLIATGFICKKTGVLREGDDKALSRLLIQVLNPCIIISSMAGADSVDRGSTFMAFLVALIMFAMLIFLGTFLSGIFSTDKVKRNIYKLMFSFSNLGFIGIPFVKAMFGAEYLVYVAIFIFEYNVFYYTYGALLFSEKGSSKFDLMSFRYVINPGTIACVIALLIFALQIKLPTIINSAVTHLGNAAIPISLIIVGYSVKEESFTRMFTRWKNWLFLALKMIIIPIAYAFIIKLFHFDEVLTEVAVILTAMPVGTMPMATAAEKGIDGEFCAENIVMTTLLSVGTIPLVILLYQFRLRMM